MNIGRRSDSSNNIFQTFSDMVFCAMIILLLLVTILALNVNEEVNRIVAPNKFSGGIRRPTLYLDAYRMDYTKTSGQSNALNRQIFGTTEIPRMVLYSQSRALASTIVDKESWVMQTQVPGQTYSGQFMGLHSDIADLFSGIDIGTFTVGKSETPLLLLEYGNKGLYSNTDNSHRFDADREMADSILTSINPAFANQQYDIRAFEEYRDQRLRIYIESRRTTTKDGKVQRSIIIGHRSFLVPQSIEDGSLAFFTALSSPLTEVIYLGEYKRNLARRDDKRSQFFAEHGFKDASRDYQKYVFPSNGDFDQLKEYGLAWEDLNASQKNIFLTAFDPQEAKEKYQRFALRKVRAINSAKELKKGSNAWLPPLLKHKAAWQSYCKHYEEQGFQTPRWVQDEFLKPLGFDKRIVRFNPNSDTL